MTRKPTFVARFERVKPMADDPDGYRQLRWSLKRLLRMFGWECVSAIEVEEQGQVSLDDSCEAEVK